MCERAEGNGVKGVVLPGFVKIYGDRLLRSTLWLECSWQARLVFLGMLALSDQDGIVDVHNVHQLAALLRLSEEDTRAGLAELEAPDPQSRSADEEGRRVVFEGDHWRLVNYQKYREFRTLKQEADRRRQAQKRAAKKAAAGSEACDLSQCPSESPKSQESLGVADVRQVSHLSLSDLSESDQSTSRANPERLKAVLSEEVRAEYFRRGIPSERAADGQWLQACVRVQEALDLKLFTDAHEACAALAKAAVAENLKSGKALAFALQQVPFTAHRKPPPDPSTIRGYDAPEEL